MIIKFSSFLAIQVLEMAECTTRYNEIEIVIQIQQNYKRKYQRTLTSHNSTLRWVQDFQDQRIVAIKS